MRMMFELFGTPDDVDCAYALEHEDGLGHFLILFQNVIGYLADVEDENVFLRVFVEDKLLYTWFTYGGGIVLDETDESWTICEIKGEMFDLITNYIGRKESYEELRIK